MKRYFFIFILAVGFTSQQAISGDGKFNYEPQVVSFTGKLTQKIFFGPPGFGESPNLDSKEKQYILVLNAQIDVEGDGHSEINTPTEKGVKEITLTFAGSKNGKLDKLIDQQVSITGTLFHSHTGHHHTKILMKVEKIELK